MIFTPCHKLSHFLRPFPPLERDIYFMDGPLLAEYSIPEEMENKQCTQYPFLLSYNSH